MGYEEHMYDSEEQYRINDIENIVADSELIFRVINEIVDERLREQYFEKILPLEREIKKLGGTLPEDKKDTLNLEVKFLKYTPLDPFKEQDKLTEYWRCEESDYYRFFKALLSACMERSWIIVNSPYTVEDASLYWLKMFRCVDEYNIILKASTEEIVRPFEWQGKVNLCIYLNDKLRKEKYVTTSKNNHIIKQHFLPDSDIANSRNQAQLTKTGKPTGYEEVDNIISEILNTLD